MSTIDQVLGETRVLPVLTVDRVEDAAPLADALYAGGLKVVELTLRTPAALDALRAMKAAKPDIVVGMGTVLRASDITASLNAGADFLVTPGTPASLAAALAQANALCLPGAATVSESMALLEAGFSVQKFFPAEASGGVAALKSMGGPIPAVTFCPTGGVTLASAPEYLALGNVRCVGGTWIAPKPLVNSGDWATIEANARAASSLGAPHAQPV